jgi:lipoprotein-releasing system permease protein
MRMSNINLLLCNHLKEQRYISNRLLAPEKSSKSALRLITTISKISVIIGTVVILVTAAILSGFKYEIIHGLSSFNGNISVQSYESLQGKEDSKILLNPSIEGVLKDYGATATKVIFKNGIIKAGENIEGCLIKGVNNYNTFSNQFLKQGTIPSLDSGHLKEVMISEKLSEKLNVKLGQKILCYFIIPIADSTSDQIQYNYKVRDLIVKGIYATGFEEIDTKTIVGNLALLQKLEKNFITTNEILDSTAKSSAIPNYASSISEIEIVSKAKDIDTEIEKINTNLNANEIAVGLQEKYSNVFLWLSLLDNNAVIIIVLMIIVAIINMISAVIVLIIENTSNIGLLKALGANNGQVSKLFFSTIFNNIISYVLIGNAIGIGLLLLQYYFHILPLDSNTYYVSYIPVSIDWWRILTLDVIIILSCLIATLLPLLIIIKIKPSTILKFS